MPHQNQVFAARPCEVPLRQMIEAGTAVPDIGHQVVWNLVETFTRPATAQELGASQDTGSHGQALLRPLLDCRLYSLVTIGRQELQPA